MIEFTVPLAPVPKGRPRFTIIGKGPSARVGTFTPPETQEAERSLRLLSMPFRPRKPLAGAIGVTTVHVVAPPLRFDADRSHDWPHVKPDDDNYRKLVLDALNGLFWRDDGQICGGASWKVYGENPRTFIRIWQLGRDDLSHVRAMIGDPMPQTTMFEGEANG